MKAFTAIVLVLATAAHARADGLRSGPIDRSGTRIVPAAQLHAQVDERAPATVVYDATGASAFSGFTAPTTGVIGYDDYVSTVAAPSFAMPEFSFAGGVAAAGQIMFFTFFLQTGPTTFAPVASFGAAFPSGGNFLWTITFAPSTALTVPSAGLLQAYADTGFYVPSIGQWRVKSQDAVVVGSNDPLVFSHTGPGGEPLVSAIRLTAPDPATVSLCALGCLVLARRRS